MLHWKVCPFWYAVAFSNEVCFSIGRVDFDAVSTGIAVTGTHDKRLHTIKAAIRTPHFLFSRVTATAKRTGARVVVNRTSVTIRIFVTSLLTSIRL